MIHTEKKTKPNDSATLYRQPRTEIRVKNVFQISTLFYRFNTGFKYYILYKICFSFNTCIKDSLPAITSYTIRHVAET